MGRAGVMVELARHTEWLFHVNARDRCLPVPVHRLVLLLKIRNGGSVSSLRFIVQPLEAHGARGRSLGWDAG